MFSVNVTEGANKVADAQLSLVESVKPLSYKSSKVSVLLFIAVTASINGVVKRAHVKSRAHVQGDYL